MITPPMAKHNGAGGVCYFKSKTIKTLNFTTLNEYHKWDGLTGHYSFTGKLNTSCPTFN